MRYLRGGYITKCGLLSTQGLQDKVAKQQLSAVEIEIERALQTVEKDPMNAALYAATVLEASLKAYLNHHSIVYKEESEKLPNLWNKVAMHIGLQPKNFSDEDVKKIASGLYEIVKGTMNLRNKKSAAHGRSEEHFKQNIIRPRHARLAIHAAHTISAYILEFTEEG
ncbi:abortive infection family protein [Bartonella machadoae]|uniref:abortive infection family protein n=1 Tax=Bartonella machadoae TaxID=2893471 RepID=UPI001F4D19F8|nr:abortive infection family protein [Bartonella machadoae]UNE53811.1 abortive infection family protein [Bartonella machadoae]